MEEIIDEIMEARHKDAEKRDNNGSAEKFKNCTKVLFSGVNEYFKSEEVHFRDIHFNDGYFVIGVGTNSVVDFHIDECPGWLFGIWWSVPEDGKKCVNGSFFAQYEENIDKFKPSDSVIGCEISVVPSGDENEDEYVGSCYEPAKLIDFIHTEPYLAFCRDYLLWNYNHEYHTREEAKVQYDIYVRYKFEKNECEKAMNEKFMEFIREKVMPLYVGSEIEDRGEEWCPRYLVVAPWEENRDLTDNPGMVSFCNGRKELEQEYLDLVKESDEMAFEKGFIYFQPFDEFVYLRGVRTNECAEI